MKREEMHQDVLRVFNDVCYQRGKQRPAGVGFAPLADVYFDEGEREIVVRFEVPGMRRDDIQLYVERRQIIVGGSREFAGGENRVYQQVEMDYGRFERRIRLTVDVDVDETQATYEAGILEVRLALLRHESKPQQIEIHVEDETGEKA